MVTITETTASSTFKRPFTVTNKSTIMRESTSTQSQQLTPKIVFGNALNFESDIKRQNAVNFDIVNSRSGNNDTPVTTYSSNDILAQNNDGRISATDDTKNESTRTGRSINVNAQSSNAANTENPNKRYFVKNILEASKNVLLKAQNNRDKIYPLGMLSLSLITLIVVLVNKQNNMFVVLTIILLFVLMLIFTFIIFRM
ncbi:hypothetical protein HT594_00053 [Phenacoccus solenopsis nudivirus]|nr:hypothetical protein HT594_00053 [Phenacoccus solenopsis nudivirus]